MEDGRKGAKGHHVVEDPDKQIAGELADDEGKTRGGAKRKHGYKKGVRGMYKAKIPAAPQPEQAAAQVEGLGEEGAALRVQCAFRSYRARSEFYDLLFWAQAAETLQSAWRCHAARVKVKSCRKALPAPPADPPATPTEAAQKATTCTACDANRELVSKLKQRVNRRDLRIAELESQLAERDKGEELQKQMLQGLMKDLGPALKELQKHSVWVGSAVGEIEQSQELASRTLKTQESRLMLEREVSSTRGELVEDLVDSVKDLDKVLKNMLGPCQRQAQELLQKNSALSELKLQNEALAKQLNADRATVPQVLEKKEKVLMDMQTPNLDKLEATLQVVEGQVSAFDSKVREMQAHQSLLQRDRDSLLKQKETDKTKQQGAGAETVALQDALAQGARLKDEVGAVLQSLVNELSSSAADHAQNLEWVTHAVDELEESHHAAVMAMELAVHVKEIEEKLAAQEHKVIDSVTDVLLKIEENIWDINANCHRAFHLRDAALQRMREVELDRDRLQSELAKFYSADRQLKELEKQATELQQANRSLQKFIGEEKSVTDHLRKKLLDSEVEAMNRAQWDSDRHQKEGRALDSLEKSTAVCETQLIEANTEAKNQISALSSQVAQLKSELLALKAKQQQLDEVNSESAKASGKHLQELLDTKQEAEGAQLKVNALEAQVSQLTEQKAKLDNQLSELDAQLQQKDKDTSRELEASELKASNLQAEMNKLQLELEAKEKAITETGSEVQLQKNELDQKNSELSKELQDARQQISSLTIAIAKLTEDKSQLQSQHEQLQTSSVESADSKAKQLQEFERALQDLEASRKAVAALEAKISGLEKDKGELETKNSAANQDLDSSRDKISTLEAKVAKATEEAEQSEMLRKQLESVNDKSADVARDMVALQTMSKEQARKLEEFDTQVTQLQADLEVSRTQRAEVEQRNAILTKQAGMSEQFLTSVEEFCMALDPLVTPLENAMSVTEKQTAERSGRHLTQISGLSDRLVSLTQSLELKESELQSLRQERSEWESEKTSLKELADKKDANETGQISTDKLQYENMKEKLQEVVNLTDKYEHIISGMSVSTIELEKDFQMLQKACHQMQIRGNSASADALRIAQLEAVLQEKEALVASQHGTMDALSVAVDALKGHVDASQKEMHAAVKERDSTIEALTDKLENAAHNATLESEDSRPAEEESGATFSDMKPNSSTPATRDSSLPEIVKGPQAFEDLQPQPMNSSAPSSPPAMKQEDISDRDRSGRKKSSRGSSTGRPGDGSTRSRSPTTAQKAQNFLNVEAEAAGFPHDHPMEGSRSSRGWVQYTTPSRPATRGDSENAQLLSSAHSDYCEACAFKKHQEQGRPYDVREARKLNSAKKLRKRVQQQRSQPSPGRTSRSDLSSSSARKGRPNTTDLRGGTPGSLRRGQRSFDSSASNRSSDGSKNLKEMQLVWDKYRKDFKEQFERLFPDPFQFERENIERLHAAANAVGPPHT